MKPNSRMLACWLPIIIFSLLFLSACASAPTSPSAAMRQQLETIQRQQQQQAEQLRSLQEQLAQMQTGGSKISTPLTLPSPLPSVLPSDSAKTAQPSAAVTAEISALAESASTYLAAFSDLAAGRFAPAESGFNLFLREYPQHQYAPNARYWLASAQASQNKLQAAMSNLRQLVIADNGQGKAPAAMTLLAQIYRRQDWHNEADEILEQLRTRYPDSPEAQHSYQSDKPR
ncbi:MAG TPA: tetratricopeptide repeat protein [Malonomonas sp.]